MENNFDIKQVAKDFYHYIWWKENKDFDYENSKIQGLFCQATSVAFYLYVKEKYNIKIDIVSGIFLSDEFEEYIHYWCEYDNYIIDYTMDQFIDVLEDNGIPINPYQTYILDKEQANLFWLYIWNKKDNNIENFEKIKSEYDYFTKIIKEKWIDNILD